ncbi:MAG TPA: TonB-dependent receptor [Gemmatimonadaceae bacterium]|nr:TonB-dependent receptor [Gemmatimonadaceae bacterium]
MRYAFGAMLLLLGGQSAAAQSVVRGIIVSASAPVAGANVFIVETLAGALTDSSGRFSFTTSHTGSATIVVQARGFAEQRRVIQVPSAEQVTIILRAGTQTLAPTTVSASRYAASDERGATLTTLDVVSTPGTNADVARAIQTLPGVQQVDEGTALYVRGGDYTETHVLLDDAVLHTAFTFESPNGTFIGTVDPFLLDGIFFSSGGFGARYGNALSGIAALNTMGRAARPSVTAGAGLAALSVSGAIPIGACSGLRVAANEFDTDLLFKVNGSTQEFRTPPRGFDRSASYVLNYRPTGELKIFGIRQSTGLASIVDDPSYSGAYTMDLSSGLIVANWRDVFGRWSPKVRVSDTRMDRTQDYGAFRMGTGQAYRAASAQLDWSASPTLTLRAGSDFERTWSELDGSIPNDGFDKAPGARVTVVGSRFQGDRVSAFGESDFVAGSRTRIVAGIRSDRSTLTGSTTVDPRVSAAITLARDVVVTGAWGIYHQVPDPLFFDATLGVPGLPSMRATHAIAGIQAGTAGRMARLELFEKRYNRLAQATRDFDIAADGIGSSRGADLFLSGTAIPGMRWRLSLSAISARRTDPSTGQLTNAPFDVTRSLTAVITHAFTPAWHAGITQRYATGRPYTPVLSARFDAARNVYVPEFADPMSDRLPSFRRTDLSFTHLRQIASSNVVIYAAVSNLMDRENIHAYRWSTDYSERIPIRSLFKRSYYVGASFTRQ